MLQIVKVLKENNILASALNGQQKCGNVFKINDIAITQTTSWMNETMYKVFTLQKVNWIQRRKKKSFRASVPT